MSSARSVQIPKNVKRKSSEKTLNDPFFELDNFLYFDYEDIDKEDDQEIDGQEEDGKEDDEQVEDGLGEDGQGEDGQEENGQVVGVQQEDEERN